MYLGRFNSIQDIQFIYNTGSDLDLILIQRDCSLAHQRRDSRPPLGCTNHSRYGHQMQKPGQIDNMYHKALAKGLTSVDPKPNPEDSGQKYR